MARNDNEILRFFCRRGEARFSLTISFFCRFSSRKPCARHCFCFSLSEEKNRTESKLFCVLAALFICPQLIAKDDTRSVVCNYASSNFHQNTVRWTRGVSSSCIERLVADFIGRAMPIQLWLDTICISIQLRFDCNSAGHVEESGIFKAKGSR